MKTLLKAKKLILDTLFPVSCIGCGRDDTWLCKKCLQGISVNDKLACPVCRKKNAHGTCSSCKSRTHLDGLVISTSYENEIVQKAIHALKYNFVQSISRHLSELIMKSLEQIDKKTHPAILKNRSETITIPVPLHKKRILERGFNQSVLLGKIVAEEMNFIFNDTVLSRVHSTEPQAQLNKKDRERNIINAFSISGDFNFYGKNVILVDDVSTTCSTLNECAKVLKTRNCSTVWGLVIARG